MTEATMPVTVEQGLAGEFAELVTFGGEVGSTLVPAEMSRRILTALTANGSQPDRVVDVRGAIDDALAGWRYIRAHHGDLYGVGWDRVEARLTAALSTLDAKEAEQ